MAKKPGPGLGIVAIIIYIIGGLGAFGGLILVGFWKDENIWGLGSGLSIGLLLLCTGCALSILGVILMRVFRTRGLT